MKQQGIQADSKKAKSTVLRKVGNSRAKNDQLRGRRHLIKLEIDCICKTIRKHSRYADRDELMVLTAFHHGFRASELVNLKWQDVILQSQQIAVKRLKNGNNTQQPIACKRELMLFKRIHKAIGKPTSGFVFLNERGHPVSTDGFRKMFGKFSMMATGIRWNPHALRHACGTELINQGHDIRLVQSLLGHRNIQNTVVYLHESARQFDKVSW